MPSHCSFAGNVALKRLENPCWSCPTCFYRPSDECGPRRRRDCRASDWTWDPAPNLWFSRRNRDIWSICGSPLHELMNSFRLATWKVFTKLPISWTTNKKNCLTFCPCHCFQAEWQNWFVVHLKLEEKMMARESWNGAENIQRTFFQNPDLHNKDCLEDTDPHAKQTPLLQERHGARRNQTTMLESSWRNHRSSLFSDN